MAWADFEALAEIFQSAGPDGIQRVLSAHLDLLIEDPVFERVAARTDYVLSRTREMLESPVNQLSDLLDTARLQGRAINDIDAAALLLLVCGIAHSVRGAGLSADSVVVDSLKRLVLNGRLPAGEDSRA